MPKGLYLPDGSYRPLEADALTSAYATRQAAGVALTELEGWLDLLPDPDPVLRRRGDDAAVLAELTADDQVTTAILSRKNRVLNCPHFAFRAGSADGEPATAQAEDLYRRFAQNLERCNLRGIISSILDAPFYGFVPLEILWGRGADWWHIVDVVARPCRWFAFDNRNNPVFKGVYGGLAAEPRPLPAGKFVLVRHHATYDNPYGLRLLSRCLWPVAVKRGGLTFYAKFVERHGLPWVVGKAPKGATAPEKRVMARDLAGMVQDAVAVLPFGSEVTLEGAGQTQGALHEAFLARQDRAISKVLMGQTLTVEMEGKNSQAAAQTHKDVADDLADSDKAMVADAWNEIAWLYAQVNVGPGVLAPLAGYEEPEDLNSRADLDKKLTDIGVAFTAEHFVDNYGLKPTEFTVRPVTTPGAGANFAAPTARKKTTAEKAQGNLDAAIVKMLPAALKSSRDFVTQVENEIRAAKSYEELEEALAALLSPSMAPDALESFLARAMTMAAGHGAASVQTEADEDG